MDLSKSSPSDDDEVQNPIINSEGDQLDPPTLVSAVVIENDILVVTDYYYAGIVDLTELPSIDEQIQEASAYDVSIFESILGRLWDRDDARRFYAGISGELRRRNLINVDLTGQVYNEILERAIRQEVEYLRADLEAIWTREDEDLLFNEINQELNNYYSVTLRPHSGVGVTEETIRRCLKTRKHCNEESEDAAGSDEKAEICVICQDCLYEERETTIATLECGHDYHVDCIIPWLIEGDNTCPTCRATAIHQT